MTGNEEDTGRMADADIARERRNAEPEARDLTDPKEVWKNGETAPARAPRPQSGMLGRVADAGDIGEGTPSPYDTEVAADAVGTVELTENIDPPARVIWDERREGRKKFTKPLNRK